MNEVKISGRHYEYEEFNTIHDADPMALATVLRAQAQVIEDGFADGMTFEPDDAINVLFDSEDNIAAFMTYSSLGSIERTVTLAWVREDLRKQKLHTFLFEALKHKSKKHGFYRIVRGHHKDNHASALAQLRQGSYMYETHGDYVYTRTDLR